MAVQGARKGPQLTRQGVLAFAAVVWRAAFGAQRFPSDIQGFLAGCPVVWRTDFVGLAEQGTLPAKDWISLSQSVETVKLHVWLAGKLLASALVNLVPQLSDGVN